ncbi:hypothetical protein AB0M92_01390 [Streptomyces sp. NPDC051582]|uniref:hypothetical protein n=1 Tax=Streptomyces sp. NPDC051582 TaxID=3155167 RepID=UPI003435CC40
MRNKFVRIALLAPLVASPLILGPMASARPAAAAPAAGTCKASESAYTPKANKWSVFGDGFPANTTVAVKGDNGYSDPSYQVTGDGKVRIVELTAGHYTVGGVACTGGADPAKDGTGTGTDTGKDPKAQYDAGFQKGFQAIKNNCTAVMPKTLTQVDPNYQKGYDNGAALAAKTFCGGQTGGKKGMSQYDRGYKLGFDRTKATCRTTPPQSAVPPGPEWLRGYHAGAAKAAARFC